MKYKIELEFDVDDSKTHPTIGLLAYYLERNTIPILNTIFDDIPKNLFVPDEVMTYKVTEAKQLNDK